MSTFNQQIHRMAERYKAYENKHELREDIESILLQLKEEDITAKAKPSLISALVNERIQQFKNPVSKSDVMMKTGFEDYDNSVGGLAKGEFMVIGGRPGMGKSLCIIDMCIKIAEQGKACGFLSLDMSAFILANRFISNISKIYHDVLIRGNLEENTLIKINEAAAKINKLPIFVCDKNIGSASSVIESCKKLVAENKVEVIFIDYLQMIGNFNRRNNREMELANLCRELKNLAKELNIALIVTSQLSRQVENRPGSSKRPMLSDLRESGAIEQDADKVIFLYRPEYYGLEVDENNEPTRYVVELIIAKNKTGGLDNIKMMIEDGFTGFKKYTGPHSEINISKSRLSDFDQPPF